MTAMVVCKDCSQVLVESQAFILLFVCICVPGGVALQGIMMIFFFKFFPPPAFFCVLWKAWWC